MANRLLTEDQVKEMFEISDFRHLTKRKVIQIVSALPNMDKEVAIKAIEQFPEFSGLAEALVAHCETTCDSILKENDSNVQAVMNGYKKTLDVLGELAKSKDLDPMSKRFFAETMVEVADKMAAFDINNKDFLAGIAKHIAWISGCALIAASAFLGLKYKEASALSLA